MKTIGQILKKTREDQNISLRDLANNLKIQIEYLEAIENNELTKTPGEPYTLGYIKSYAKYFNLDVSYIITLHKNTISSQSSNNDIVLPSVGDPSHYNYLKYGFASFIFIAFSLFFFKFFLSEAYLNNQYAITPELSDEMIALLEEQEIKEDLKKYREYKDSISQFSLDSEIDFDNRSALASTSNEYLNEIGQKIILKFLEDTWIQIKDSEENIIISKLMRKQDEFILDEKKKYFITTGNAGNIQIRVNNKNLGKLGNKGEVLNLYNFNFHNFEN